MCCFIIITCIFNSELGVCILDAVVDGDGDCNGSFTLGSAVGRDCVA